MGTEQSRQSRQPNERSNSRNYSEADVQRALDLQKEQLEREMNDLILSQAARARQQQGSSTSSNTERQRSPYSYTQNHLADSVNQPRSPLYPTLSDNGNRPAGNNNHSPQNPQGGYVLINSNHLQTFSPSAPPAPQQRQSRNWTGPKKPRQRAESDDVACPTCKYRYTEKIFNCASGHASCSECMEAQLTCGRCRERITDRRNITMEEYVSQKRTPCPNAREGCSLSFMQGDIERHLKECPFNDVKCMLPTGMCKWTGKLSLLAAHFDQFHPAYRSELDTEAFLPINITIKTIQLIKVGNYNFIVNMNSVDNTVFVAVQLLGTKAKHSASKWTYELHIYNKAEPRRKYVFMDKCFSKTDSFDDIVKQRSCAVLPYKYAKTFENGSGVVAYKIFLKKGDGFNEDKTRDRDASCTRRGRGGRGRGRGRGRNYD